MNSTEFLTPFLQIAMISLRVASLWMFFPIFSQSTISARIRVMGMLVLAMALYPTVGKLLPRWDLQALPSTAVIVSYVAQEFLVGAGMGLLAKWVFTTFIAAAHWVSVQMGFGVAGLYDPETQNSESSWADFNQWVGVMIFFAIGGHIYFIQALAESYKFDLTHTFDALLDVQRSTQLWGEVGGRFFLWMLKLSAPMAIVLLMIQLGLGVLSKFVPQINLWSVSLPITLGVGVLVFTFFSPMYSDALQDLFRANHELPFMWLKYLTYNGGVR